MYIEREGKKEMEQEKIKRNIGKILCQGMCKYTYGVVLFMYSLVKLWQSDEPDAKNVNSKQIHCILSTSFYTHIKQKVRAIGFEVL